MKTKITLVMLSVFLTAAAFAQGKASVYASNSDISDNLDLRAVASIFGDSKNLSDFEYRLNDPNSQISNLDLNNDNQVDYLRVVEIVQNNTHVVVLQSVLQEDLYQDVATIVISKRKNKQVYVQVIGDPYMYGSNYIYEPVYVVRPPLYSNFWVTNYSPYRSYYGWNRYPAFFTSWNPYSYGHYHQNIYVHINHNNYYNYSSNIYNSHANDYYRKYRSNGYEQKYPHRDFKHRTSQVNRYDYDRVQSARSPQVTTGLRPSSTYQNQGRSISSARTAEPARSVTTARPAAVTARPATTGPARATTSSRPTVTTARPSAAVPARSVTTARPASTVNNRPTTTQNSNRERPMTSSHSPAPKSSNSSQRPSVVTNQNTQQRGSNMSAQSSQHNSGSRSASPSSTIR